MLPAHLARRLCVVILACGWLSDRPTLGGEASAAKPDASLSGWRLVGGGGRVVEGADGVWEVTGDGQGSSYWRSEDLRFQPGRQYAFRVRIRRISGTGTAITGPDFANRDHSDLPADWKWFGHIFRVPDGREQGFLRAGQWEASGAIQFAGATVTPVIPVHRAAGELVLGEGETVQGGQYAFHGAFAHEGSNDHRTLASATAGFNSNRWTFAPGSHVTYRLGIAGHQLLSGSLEFDVNYSTHGECLAEVSRDGQAWRAVTRQPGEGTAAAEVPADLLPASAIWLRLRAADGPANFQVNRIDFRARLDGPAAEAIGSTDYAEQEAADDRLRVESLTLRRDPTGAGDVLRAVLRNVAASELGVRLAAADAQGGPSAESSLQLAAGAAGTVDLPLPAGGAPRREIRVTARTGQQLLLAARLVTSVPDFHRADYGWRLGESAGDVALWWCEATHKVSRQRVVPQASSEAVSLEAARHDYEAAQVVVRPGRDLIGLTATAGDLVGSGGARIPAAHVRVRYAYYHFVQQPTDGTGVRDWWPDALPPLDAPLDVAAGQNQPLWVQVYVPGDAAAGDYAGSLSLAAQGWTAEVPLRLHVWDFALPLRNHLETAYGLSPGEIYRYHNVKTEEDKRKVLDLYFQSFAEHRISPYDLTPLDPIRVRFLPDQQPPRAEVDFTAFDREMSRVVERYHFTNFRLHVEGLGGGTFHERYPPKIGAFGEETPQYQATFSSYVRQVEAHLRDKGWLPMAYVYWFDEPEPRDYEFVAAGMRRLKQYAPGLTRMLTEEPGDNPLAGLVDIWCPVTPNYDHQRAEPRRAAGERFWWYVCTGPKAPYCTLFIDHPATELRIWHWQTWQRKIAGTLVWSSNYWTSSAAYPDAPQDPYLDPMGYVSGYSTPRGVKRFWGNGDGRFLYPPLAASVPGQQGGQPVLAPPVSSIRWEMIREGVEDYEFLYQLRERLQQKGAELDAETARRFSGLLEVPPAVTTSLTEFATDPAPLYEHRRKTAQALERLGR